MHQEKAKHENRDINVSVLITIVIAGSMLVLIIFVGMIAWMQTEINTIKQDRVINAPNDQLESLKSKQIANITMQGKDTQGNLHIPIDQAMEIVIEKSKNK